MVTEVTTEVWRRDEQVHDLRAELSLHALCADDASQQPNQEYAGLYQHLTGLVQDTQQHRDVWRISNWKNWLLDQKSIDFDEERENSYDKYDVKLLKEQNLRLNCQAIGRQESLKTQTSARTAIIRELHSEIMQKASVSCAARYHTISCNSRQKWLAKRQILKAKRPS